MNSNSFSQYMYNYDTLKKYVVYNFLADSGGIGDYIKYFIHLLNVCIKNDIKIYCQINNTLLEKYLHMKYKKMYISRTNFTKLEKYLHMKNKKIYMSRNNFTKTNVINRAYKLKKIPENDIYNIVTPYILYNSFDISDVTINIDEIFTFSNEIIINSYNFLPKHFDNYICIHLRLGDKFLETDITFVYASECERYYNENNIYKCIEDNSDKNIIFLCDNNEYKLKIKQKYNNVHITNCDIGHTGLLNTTNNQVLDTVTEFYVMTNADAIYCGSFSGFSIMASKFKRVHIYKLYE